MEALNLEGSVRFAATTMGLLGANLIEA